MISPFDRIAGKTMVRRLLDPRSRSMRGTFQGVVVAALVATLSWTEIALGLAILAAVISSPVAERN
jgi:hypothetical protein